MLPIKPTYSKQFSGPPGAGKSTSAQLMARNHGYIYYEADAFGMFANPFIDPNIDEPTLALGKQMPLKVLNYYRQSQSRPYRLQGVAILLSTL